MLRLKGTSASTHLRSECCDAPVVQDFEPGPGVYPVRCLICGFDLGMPGAEDFAIAVAYAEVT